MPYLSCCFTGACASYSVRASDVQDLLAANLKVTVCLLLCNVFFWFDTLKLINTEVKIVRHKSAE